MGIPERPAPLHQSARITITRPNLLRTVPGRKRLTKAKDTFTMRKEDDRGVSESRILALIDDMVEHASDDELFASGYLRWPLDVSHCRAGER